MHNFSYTQVIKVSFSRETKVRTLMLLGNVTILPCLKLFLKVQGCTSRYKLVGTLAVA